jgi:hypothetical protein
MDVKEPADLSELLELLLKEEFPIKLVLDDEMGMGYQIETGAKSNLTLFAPPEPAGARICDTKDRYGKCEVVFNFDYFCYVLMSCMCGRDYASDTFFAFMVKYGMMEEVKQKPKFARIHQSGYR